MTPTDLDEERLLQALALAEGAIGLSDPNPRVGCVIGRDDGTVLGQGHTQQAGGPHAEVVALRDAQALGHDVRGATAWVTLEPCAHHGRTPPCCDALVAAGLRRVVIGARDPNPRVDGLGARRLQAAGLEVRWAGGAVAAACRDINIGFFSRHERGRPWVRMKAAVSADGRVARPDGSSRWITGEAARHDGHAWRRRAGAIVTGVGTVLADDPRLDVRGLPVLHPPLRVVVDSGWRMPAGSTMLSTPGQVVVAGTAATDVPAARALAAAGAQILRLPSDSSGRVDLAALLQWLHEREVQEVHVEAGPGLNGALLEQGLVDEWLLYVAPRLIGPGLPAAHLAQGEPLGEPPRWAWHSATMVGADLRLLARRHTAHSGGVGGAYTNGSPGAATA